MANKGRERKVWWYVSLMAPESSERKAISRAFKTHAANRSSAIKKAFQEYRGLAHPDGMMPPAHIKVTAHATKGPT